MKNAKTLAEPELSRPLKVDKIPLGGVEERIVASPQEKEALAARFNLTALPSLESFLTVRKEDGGFVAVKGTFSADVVQTCVVTLDPVAAHVGGGIDALFGPAHLIREEHEGGLADLGEADPPEPIIGGVIDLGELTAQNLAMALDPYPRKEGASLQTAVDRDAALDVASPETASGNRPFSALAGLFGKVRAKHGKDSKSG